MSWTLHIHIQAVTIDVLVFYNQTRPLQSFFGIIALETSPCTGMQLLEIISPSHLLTTLLPNQHRWFIPLVMDLKAKISYGTMLWRLFLQKPPARSMTSTDICNNCDHACKGAFENSVLTI